MEIKIYTTPGCFYCDQLKELLKRAELDYNQVVVGDGQEMTLEQFKSEYPDPKGFPYVIIDGEGVGGLIETAKLFVKEGLVSSGKR